MGRVTPYGEQLHIHFLISLGGTHRGNDDWLPAVQGAARAAKFYDHLRPQSDQFKRVVSRDATLKRSLNLCSPPIDILKAFNALGRV